MRRIVLIALLAALAAAMAAPSAHAAGARLTPTGGASFPQRSYVLTLPAGASPSSSGIRVFENGQPVTRLRVRGANDRFAVVLVIDASASMRGAPIRGAIDAARAFAAQRPATQALGIVTFNARTAVAVAPTTNGSAIQRALARAPSLAPETHIYDALSTALRSASGRRFDAAAIVLLSDGHDFGSTTTPAQVTLAAQRAHAKLFTIGLRSHDFDPTTLQQVATLGSGEYLGAASPKALAGVYRRLGSELATAYSIRYLSSAPAGAAVRVTAQAGPERTGLSYAAPRLNVHGAFTGPVTASKGADPSFFATKRGAAVVALGVLLLAFFALTTVLQHRRRRGALQRRVAHYGETSRPFEVDGFGVSDDSPLEGSAFWARLHADLELARMDITPARFLLEGALMTALMAIAVLAVVGSAVLAVLALLAGPLVVWTRLRRTVAKQRRQFAEQLADSIQ
ncbi:MAG: tight adherence protein, partial [Solirubrobacteraceae bacterium]|nr:tight adherence protein [Solirubrobacteraceae bacterium]